MTIGPKNILVYRLGSLGDTILALPVFHQIRRSYPDAVITLLTNKPVTGKAAPMESILGSGYFFDKVIAYPVGTRNKGELFDLIKKIRTLKIDAVIYLAGVRVSGTVFKTKLTLLRDWLFFKVAGVKTTIGFPSRQEDIFLVNDIETGELEWETKRLARRVGKLGNIALDDETYWDLRFTGHEVAQAAEILKELLPTGNILAASTGTKSQVNHWEQHNWVNLFTKLKAVLPGWQLVMLGGGEEFDEAEKCIKAWGGVGLNLCGKVAPRVSGLVLKRAKAFIGHDSGPMHLAAAVGTPCAAIFSARHLPRQWYPRGKSNKIIYHKTDCAGCGLDVCTEQKKKCILSVSTGEVENALTEILALNL